ncbi:MAG: SH3 domain-containing protein [Eubacterium sp.]|nr:SH3 domain-containing protein [Eubacterium sp.]
MAAKNTNNKDNNTGSDLGSLKNICSKYKKYIATGAMLILLGVVITGSRAATGDGKDGDPKQGATSADDQTLADEEKLELDAYPQINELFEEYYGYYAKGDIDSLEKIAYPISETEKSYIKLVNKYVEKYENIKCYTKKGIEEGDYIASVSLDMFFKDIETGAPSMECFYVRKDENGEFYIDNAYNSQSNQLIVKENKTDVEINTLITEFSQNADVIELQKEVQKEYERALEKDEALSKMVKDTFRGAIAEWVASFENQGSSDDQTGADDQNDSQTNADDQQNDGKDTDNQQDENGSGTAVQTRTAYTTTEVNMREKRSINSELIRTLKKGTEVTIYGVSKNGWFKIKYKGKTGFARKEYFTTDKSKVVKKDNKDKDKNNQKDKNETDNKQDNSNTSNNTSVSKRTAYAKTKVNMREKRSTDSEIIKTLKAGTKVTIYGKNQNGWFKVKSKGKTGYVRKEYIVSDPSKVEKEQDTPPERPSSPSYYNEGDQITLSESVNVRQSMSENADRVGLAYQGDVLTVIMSYAEGWTKVSWNGQTGFVKTEYLR